MTTFSLKAPNENAKVEALNFFKEVKANRKDMKDNWDVQLLLIKLYNEGIESFEPLESLSVQRTLETIGCPFLKYEGYDFKCYEKFDAKKKTYDLGTKPDLALICCESCKEGKAQKILEQYQTKLRGTNIRGILQMIRTFETFAEQGVPSTIYFCNRIKGRQVMTGQKQITCTKHDTRVPIDPTCKDPPCPHFEEYIIKVEQEFPKETLALIEGIARDYERIEDLSTTPKKEVEAEQND